MKLIACLFLCLSLGGSGLATDTPGPTTNVAVYIFLHEECLISQHYTLLLNELHEKYASESVNFIGLFPNESSTELGMMVFREKYKIPFELVQDKEQALVHKFGAKVTPEVVVYAEGSQQVLYQGRIDDTYYRVGKKRRVTTTSELADVLAAVKAGQPVSTPSTEAVGCFIQRN